MATTAEEPGGLFGVARDPKRGAYKARIHFRGKEHFLGRYNTKRDAGLAYDQAARLINDTCDGAPGAGPVRPRRKRPLNFPEITPNSKGVARRLGALLEAVSPDADTAYSPSAADRDQGPADSNEEGGAACCSSGDAQGAAAAGAAADSAAATQTGLFCTPFLAAAAGPVSDGVLQMAPGSGALSLASGGSATTTAGLDLTSPALLAATGTTGLSAVHSGSPWQSQHVQQQQGQYQQQGHFLQQLLLPPASAAPASPAPDVRLDNEMWEDILDAFGLNHQAPRAHSSAAVSGSDGGAAASLPGAQQHTSSMLQAHHSISALQQQKWQQHQEAELQAGLWQQQQWQPAESMACLTGLPGAAEAQQLLLGSAAAPQQQWRALSDTQLLQGPSSSSTGALVNTHSGQVVWPQEAQAAPAPAHAPACFNSPAVGWPGPSPAVAAAGLAAGAAPTAEAGAGARLGTAATAAAAAAAMPAAGPSAAPAPAGLFSCIKTAEQALFATFRVLHCVSDLQQHLEQQQHQLQPQEHSSTAVGTMSDWMQAAWYLDVLAAKVLSESAKPAAAAAAIVAAKVAVPDPSMPNRLALLLLEQLVALCGQALSRGGGGAGAAAGAAADAAASQRSFVLEVLLLLQSALEAVQARVAAAAPGSSVSCGQLLREHLATHCPPQATLNDNSAAWAVASLASLL